MKILIVFFTSHLLLACASQSTIGDDSLIRMWSSELVKEEPFPYPFVATYSKGKNKLVFVAIKHSNQINSSSFQTIRNIVERDRFDLFVAEGFPRSYGISPERMIKKAFNDGGNGFYKGEESNYTIQLSQKMGAPFIGGEPDEVDIRQEIEKKGYSRQDLLFFYLVRQIPQWRRQKEFQKNTFKYLAEDFLKLWSNKLNVGVSPNLESFITWYQTKMEKEFLVDAVENELSAPIENSQVFTQRLSATVGKIRNLFIVRTVKAEMAKYHRVLIVYGGSHWIMQSKAWELFLGKPNIEKLIYD